MGGHVVGTQAIFQLNLKQLKRDVTLNFTINDKKYDDISITNLVLTDIIFLIT